MSTRIYLVTRNGGEPRLVRASTAAAALRHVASSTFKVGVPQQEELVKTILGGTLIENAGEDPLEGKSAAPAAEPEGA